MISTVDMERGMIFQLTNVTMHKPYTRIVRLESNSQVSTSRQKGYIPSRRIIEIESLGARGHVIGIGALSEDHEVVPVKMDWVGGGNESLGFILEE